MEHTYVYVLVLLYAGFAAALLVLHWYQPSKFARQFALSWFIDAARNLITLSEFWARGGWGNEAYAMNDVLAFFANWFLFSAFASLVGVRLPRWLPVVYIGVSTPLILLTRYVFPQHLAHWLRTPQEVRTWLTVANMVIQFLPLIVARVITLSWLCQMWRSTRLPGAFITALFCVPYTLLAFVMPIQIYFSYFPAWLSFFLLIRVFGFSLGILMLLMGRQQRALEKSEQRLRAIIEHEPEGVSVLAPDGALLDMNPAGLRMMEADDFQQCARQPLSARVVEEHRAAFRDFTEKVFAGESGILLFEITGLKGGRHWLETHATPLRDQESRATALLGITRDLTESRRADEARRLSEARYRTLFEQAPDGIIIVDPDNCCVDANRSICRMLHYTREELIGMNVSDLVAGAEDPIQQQSPKDAGDTAFRRKERPFKRKNGSIFGAEVISSIMPDGNRLEMIRDVTERKRTDARFRRLVESNAQGVFFWNGAGGITGANDAFLRCVGHSREDLEAGRLNWVAMTPEKYAPLDRRSMGELAATGSCAPFEKEFIRKDGSLVSVLVGAATFEDKKEDGVCFVIDLTERKKLEAQFLRAQRTEGIGTLAAGIAHDLNNMLTPILVSIESLKILAVDDQDLRLIETLRDNASKAAELVKRVLSFARGVEGERIILHPAQLMRDLLKMMQDTFPKTINITFTPARDLWTTTGDSTQLHQAFLNLCVNARDAMPNGGALVITMENIIIDESYAAMNPGARPAAYVMVTVEDAGTGVSPEIRDKIFEPFFTTKEFGKGTGLGLSTTLAIVKSHGGFISLCSELGKGAKFKVYLPANTVENETDGANEPAGLPAGHGELIMVVDDEKAIREIVQHTLEQFGYRVLPASHGAEAVALYVQRQSEIAAVLTDMAMPVMDGQALTIALTAINPRVRIIGSSGLESKVGNAGLEHFVAKPYTAKAMLGTLHKVLSGERSSLAEAGNGQPYDKW